MKIATCGRCGLEIRWGHRVTPNGIIESWWHREDVDHMPLVGPVTPKQVLDDMYAIAERRAAEKIGEPVDDDDEDGLDEMPPIEVHATPVEPKDPRVPTGVRTVNNLVAKTDGWETYRLTYARGPYMGSRKCLGVSDSIVLGAIQRSSGRRVVATWRDGKYDSGYTILKGQMLGPANATELKNFIKESETQTS